MNRSLVAARSAIGLISLVLTLLGATCAPQRIVSIGAGTDFACVLSDNGDVRCWGRNDVGQLGRGTSDTLPHPETARVDLPHRAVALSVGRDHACALVDKGVAFCWGDDRMSEAGAGGTPARCLDVGMPVPCRPRPVRVDGPLLFRSLAAGFRESCGITTERRVLCWGDAFADDETTDTLGLERCGPSGIQSWCRRRAASIPIMTSTQGSAPHLASFDTLAIGAFASCGLARGYTYCWGHGARWPWRKGDVSIVHSTGLSQGSVGEEHACGVGYDSVAVCWGTVGLGALGRGDTSTRTPSGYAGKPFRPIEGSRRFAAVSVGALHSCAIEATTSRLFCWGANQHGQLGIGSPDSVRGAIARSAHPRAEPVVGEIRFAHVAAGLEHTCGLALGGEVYCWGRALRGSLGRELHSAAVPVRVSDR